MVTFILLLYYSDIFHNCHRRALRFMRKQSYNILLELYNSFYLFYDLVILKPIHSGFSIEMTFLNFKRLGKKHTRPINNS